MEQPVADFFTEGAMDLEDVVEITDFSNKTLLALAQRLETSQTFQQLILREVELDEVWRRVDTVLQAERASGSEQRAIAALERVHKLVFEAHDLAADDRPQEAAGRLRQAIAPGSAS